MGRNVDNDASESPTPNDAAQLALIIDSKICGSGTCSIENTALTVHDKCIGEGATGRVYTGALRPRKPPVNQPITIPVAVKVALSLQKQDGRLMSGQQCTQISADIEQVRV